MVGDSWDPIAPHTERPFSGQRGSTSPDASTCVRSPSFAALSGAGLFAGGFAGAVAAAVEAAAGGARRSRAPSLRPEGSAMPFHAAKSFQRALEPSSLRAMRALSSRPAARGPTTGRRSSG